VTDNGPCKTLARASSTGRKALPSPQFAGILVAAHPVRACKKPGRSCDDASRRLYRCWSTKTASLGLPARLTANKSRCPGLRAPAVRCWPPPGITKSSKEPVKLTMTNLTTRLGSTRGPLSPCGPRTASLPALAATRGVTGGTSVSVGLGESASAPVLAPGPRPRWTSLAEKPRLLAEVGRAREYPECLLLDLKVGYISASIRPARCGAVGGLLRSRTGPEH
jgi:hypothetical protein